MKAKYLVPSSFSIIAIGLSCVIILMLLTHPNLRAYPHVILWSVQLFILALLLDGLDGISARLLHAESNFGVFFDTYMDFVTYAVIPAMLFFLLFGRSFIDYVIFTYIVVMGACRLSKFQTTRVETGPGAFLGLPITLNALWIVVAAFLFYGGSVFSPFFKAHYTVFYAAIVGTILIFGVLQVLNIKYPKPTKHPVIVILAIILTLASFTPFITLQSYFAAFMLLYIIYFVLSGLFLAFRGK